MRAGRLIHRTLFKKQDELITAVNDWGEIFRKLQLVVWSLEHETNRVGGILWCFPTDVAVWDAVVPICILAAGGCETDRNLQGVTSSCRSGREWT